MGCRPPPGHRIRFRPLLLEGPNDDAPVAAIFKREAVGRIGLERDAETLLELGLEKQVVNLAALGLAHGFPHLREFVRLGC